MSIEQALKDFDRNLSNPLKEEIENEFEPYDWYEEMLIKEAEEKQVEAYLWS